LNEFTANAGQGWFGKMRDTLSGPDVIPANELGPVARRITFSAAATPAAIGVALRRPPLQTARAHEARPAAPVRLAPSAEAANSRVSVPEARPDPEPIAVVLRVRPVTAWELEDGPAAVSVDPGQPGVVTIVPRNPALHSSTIRANSQAVFRFSRAFDADVTQQQVFADTTLPLVQALFRGTNGLVFAYGTSNAGKTYTIQGTAANPGILPRSLSVIFNSIAPVKNEDPPIAAVSDAVIAITGNSENECQTCPDYAGEEAVIPCIPDAEYKVFVSYLEIYNEQCFDLLLKPQPVPLPKCAPAPGSSAETEEMDLEEVIDVDKAPLRPEYAFPANRMQAQPERLKRQVLKLKEDRNAGEVYVDGLTQVEVNGVPDVKSLLDFGQKNRSVARTNVNERSSRSHTIFNIKLVQKLRAENSAGASIVRVTTSKLSIVDLAGNERTSRTNTTGDRLKEASLINKSLMNLGHCLEAMRQNQRVLNSQASIVQAENIPENRVRAVHKRPSSLAQRKIVTVPFRQSRLTRLFQHSLETGAAVMIANVSPASKDADETIHALRRAAIAREVTVVASKNRGHKTLDNSNELELQTKLKAFQTFHQTKADDDARTIKTLNQQISQLRVELDETKLEYVVEKGELEREQDELWRENERLRDNLAHAESCFAVRENELRDEILLATEDIMAQKDERYRLELERMWRDGQKAAQARADIVSNTARKKILGMEERHRREIGNSIARRVSLAVRPSHLDLNSGEEDGGDEESAFSGEQSCSIGAIARTLNLDDLEVDEEDYSDEEDGALVS
jgi:kinesin family member 20